MSLTEAQHQKYVGNLCIADNGTTHTILKSKKYFSKLISTEAVIHTISGNVDLVEGMGKLFLHYQIIHAFV